MLKLTKRYIPLILLIVPFFLTACANTNKPVASLDPVPGTYLPVSARDDYSHYVRQRLHLNPDRSYVLLKGDFPKIEEEEGGSYRLEGDRIFFSKGNSQEIVGQGRIHGNGEIALSDRNNPQTVMVMRKMIPAKRHVLIIENGTGEFALVRIKSYFGKTEEEMAVAAGVSKSCKLSDGNYYEVVRFGDGPSKFRYSKGQGFIVSAPSGQYTELRLTLHPTPQGTYKTSPASSHEFE
jgi:hypothetical protein